MSATAWVVRNLEEAGQAELKRLWVLFITDEEHRDAPTILQ